VEPPPESEVDATAFEAGVAWGAGTKLPGAGVGEVVGTSRRLAGAVDSVATAMAVGVGVATVVDDVVAALALGVA
jgi:hypothetical protein